MAGFCASYGVAMEILQWAIPQTGRTFSLGDAAANAAGALAVALLIHHQPGPEEHGQGQQEAIIASHIRSGHTGELRPEHAVVAVDGAFRVPGGTRRIKYRGQVFERIKRGARAVRIRGRKPGPRAM